MLIQLGFATLGALACAVAVAALTAPLRGWLVRVGVHDAPNARSSHTTVKPRGGGLAVLAVVLPAWLLAGGLGSGQMPWALVGLTSALAGVSFVDDVRGLSPAARLAIQFVVVVAGVVVLDPGPIVPGWLPFWLECAGIVLAWLWFTNLYNFMDGIDGITAVETLCVALGIGLVWLWLGQGPSAVTLPWLLAGAAAGFMWWNWAPSKIFLGDVGSVPIGFALGWLLVELAAGGALAAALILPGYYLLDATLTLLLRLARGERVWRAHKAHAYQRAVQRGLTHAAVARRIAATNGLLLACALWAVGGSPVWAGILAASVAFAAWLSLCLGTGAVVRA